MKLKLFCLFVFISIPLLGQTIYVFDHETNEPIHLVTIQERGTDIAAVTDETGKAELRGFSGSGQLIFRHPSYRITAYQFKEIERQNFRIFLSEEITQMDDVVVSVNRWEQYKEDIPQQISEFKAKDIALAEPQTAADILNMNSQVFVQKSQLGGGSPMIRGFAANSVLVVIDGVRLNNAIYRGGNLQNIILLDPNVIDKAEVVFGPTSVVYGSDALGGVIDFHTKVPTFSDGDFLSVSSGGMLRFSSANLGLTGNYNIEFRQQNFSSFSSVSYSRFDDLRMGSQRTDEFPDYGKRSEYIERINGTDMVVQNENENLQRFTGYDQYNFLQKFRWKLGSFSDVTYSFHYSNSSDIPRYDRLILRDQNDELLNAEWYYGPQLWQMHSLQNNFTYPTQFYDRLELTTAFQLTEESRHDRRFNSEALRNRKEKVDILSVNLDAFKSIGINDELYYGLEAVSNEVESTAFIKNINTNETSPISTRYPDGGSNYNFLALYFSAKNQISNRFLINTGLRYTYTLLDAQFEDDTFFNFPFEEIDNRHGALTGNIGLVYKARTGWRLSALISSGFRAPNVDDVAKVFDSEPGSVVVPNPDLKPEYSYNLEYAINRTFKNGLEINFNNYFSKLRNALVRRSFTFNGNSEIIYDGITSRVYAEQNVGEAFIWGITLNATWKIGDALSLFGTLNIIEGKDTIEELPLRHVTPSFGELGMSTTFKDLTSTFIVKFSGGTPFEDLAPSEQNKTHLYTSDGALPWYIINIHNSYQLNDYYSIHLNIENLFDLHYRPYASGISAPGLNATISVRARL